MGYADQEHFREVLHERRRKLTEWLNASEAEQLENVTDVRAFLSEIQEALDRLDHDDYGTCTVCGGTVEHQLLEMQPTARVCLDCISKEERQDLEEDLYIASHIHRALLPQSMPAIDGFEAGIRSLAAGSVGGDYYDFFSGDDFPSTRIVIADAMGKGLPASLLMSNLQGALRILSTEIPSPGPLLARLNTWMCRNLPVTKFISLVCLGLEGTADEATRLTYSNAGHCEPILLRNDGTVERLTSNGGVLGVHEGFTYCEQVMSLRSGDLLALYTDGVIEAENGAGEQYEDDRLIRYLSEHREQPPLEIIDGLVRDVLRFSGRKRPEDDLTVMVLRKQ